MRFLLLLSRQSRGLGSDAETGTAILGWSRENLKFPIFYSLQLNKEANDETTFNRIRLLLTDMAPFNWIRLLLTGYGSF